MSERAYTIFVTFIGAVCGYVIIHRVLSLDSLTLRNALIPGFFVGFGLAVVTVEIAARIKATRVNGWTTVFGCSLPGNDTLLTVGVLNLKLDPQIPPAQTVAKPWKSPG